MSRWWLLIAAVVGIVVDPSPRREVFGVGPADASPDAWTVTRDTRDASAGASRAELPPGSPRYIAPVEAPVADPFRAPSNPYGPGNRGIEYATAPGTIVRAAAAGIVAFAGPIGGERYVSIDHPDGIRTTYSYLATIAVIAGQGIAQGDPLGTTGTRLHFGARRYGEYIDPATLLGPRSLPTTTGRAHLVRIDRPWT